MATTRTSRSSIKLSRKEYTKITASLRKARQDYDVHDPDSDDEGDRRHSQSFFQERSFLDAPLNCRLDTSNNAHSSGVPTLELAHMPLHVQQAVILNDLLFVLFGIPGEYITLNPDYSPEDDDPLRGITYVCHRDLDPSLTDLVKRIIPLATYYTALEAFIASRSHLEYGLVNHALCASLRDIIKDYQTLLTQLETAFHTTSLTLQKLFFHIHPILQSFSLLYSLIGALSPPIHSPSSTPAHSDEEDEEDEEERAKNALLGIHSSSALKTILRSKGDDDASAATKYEPPKGGELLTVLTRWKDRHAGNPMAVKLLGRLLRDSAKPYVNMLRCWITKGHLDDPHGEFCVRESRGISRGTMESDYIDEYWERRYTLRGSPTSSRPTGLDDTSRHPASQLTGSYVPPQLERWKHKILLAGKYLNVIRECGIDVGDLGSNWEDSDGVNLDDEQLHALLHDCYTQANSSLLQLLIRTHHLLPRLRSLKRLFFLSQSSWLTHLLELASAELRKSARSSAQGRIQSLLEVCLRESGIVGWPAAFGGQASSGAGVGASASTWSVVSAPNTMTGSTFGINQAVSAMPVSDDGLGYGLFKEDVRVKMEGTGLYDFLIKINSTKGAALGEDGYPAAEGAEREREREEKESKDKKPLLGIDALCLDYIVPFPLSLVLSRKSILSYQLIFRFLLHLKHVEQSLCAMFVEHQQRPWRARVVPLSAAPSTLSKATTVPGSATSAQASRPPSRARSTTPVSAVSAASPTQTQPPLSPAYLAAARQFDRWRQRVFLLRARMLSWVQSILAFATFEVLEPNWRKLEGKLEKLDTRKERDGRESVASNSGIGTGLPVPGISTVDEVMKEHVDFLDTCLKECMLTSVKLLKAFSKLMQTCSTFALYSSRLTESCAQGLAAFAAENSATDGGSGSSSLGQEMNKRLDFLMKFEQNFNHWFKIHLGCVQFYASSENVSLLPLVVRLNAVKIPGHDA